MDDRPGPLRILAVIASPDRDGGPAQDYEHELATLLERVDAARRDGAHVRILNWGSAAAIREALAAERSHILHLTCAAGPDGLELERPDGSAERVTAAAFVEQVLPARHQVPLVVLAGAGDELAGFARSLDEQGVPAMTAPATDQLAELYRSLARGDADPPAPALLTGVWSMPLADPPAPEPARPGDLVGRRAEVRRLLAALRGPDPTGVLIHGTGGIGKSSLATAVLRELAANEVVTIVHGPRTVDEILARIVKDLELAGADAGDLAELADTDKALPERMTALHGMVVRGFSLVLLLDDATPVAGPFLERFLAIGPGARVVLTAPAPGSFAGLVESGRLAELRLGPLSPVETALLGWRLPLVYGLERTERERAYRLVGGHPRALEYLEALLRARPFAAVAERLEGAPAPAEVLLDALYHGLDDAARRLLVAASVFRTPVDLDGLNRVLDPASAPEPDRLARLRHVYERLRDAEPGTTLDTLPLPIAEREQLDRDLLGAASPPHHPDLIAARDELLDLRLLTPVRTGGGERYVVNRSTAESLRGLSGDEVHRAAHARAAAYHRSTGDLTEACFHLGVAGDLDARAATAAELCARLHARGAYDEEGALCDELLAVLPPDSARAALFLRAKAAIAVLRAEYPLAVALQQRCLAIAGATGDLVAGAVVGQQLGVIAQLRGDPPEAERCYRAAMALCYEVGLDASVPARAVVAACYQQLGAFALERGDPDEAWRWSSGALDIVDELDGSTVLSATEDDLARLAAAYGDTALADEHVLRAVERHATQPDLPRLAATASLQLAAVHVLNDRPDEAHDLLGRAVALAQRLDDRPLLARCLQLSGDVLVELRQLDAARSAYERQRELAHELDDLTGLIVVHRQLGLVAAAGGDPEGAAQLFDAALRLAERSGDPRLLATIHLRRGGALPADAHAYLSAALEAARSAGDDQLGVSALLHLAGLAASTGDVERAVGLVQQGVELARDEHTAIACQLTRGLLERQRDADDAATGWIDRARDRAMALGYRRAIAACDLHLARIAAERGDPARAVSLYRHCLDTAGLDRHAELVWYAWRELGWCLAESGEHEAAVPALTRALDLVSGTGRPTLELWCLVRLMWSQGNLVWQDSIGEPAEVVAIARRCGELARSLPDSAFVAVGLLCAGDGALHAGDEPAAREHYEQALAVARECGPWAASQLIDGMWQLGRLAQLDGDAATADEHFRLAGLAADDLGDPVAVVHVLRQLGRTRRDLGDATAARTALEDSWRKAFELGDARLAAASDLLLADLDEAAGRAEAAADRRARVASRFAHRGGAPDRAEDHPVYLAAARAWHELQWARRLRVADGETPFTQPVGQSIEAIVREIAPRSSLISGVPAAVAPHR